MHSPSPPYRTKTNTQFKEEKIMTATKTETTPSAEMPKSYRLTREDYPRLQSCRRIARVEKIKTREYTDCNQLQDMAVTFRLRGKQHEAPNLTAWGAILAEQIAINIEAWTPEQSVITLTEMLAALKFCDPSIIVDLTKVKTANIPAKLSGIVVVADSAGFGLDNKLAILQLDDVLSAITQAEKLGMTFVKR
jgi:hypothetical protein